MQKDVISPHILQKRILVAESSGWYNTSMSSNATSLAVLLLMIGLCWLAGSKTTSLSVLALIVAVVANLIAIHVLLQEAYVHVTFTTNIRCDFKKPEEISSERDRAISNGEAELRKKCTEEVYLIGLCEALLCATVWRFARCGIRSST